MSPQNVVPRNIDREVDDLLKQLDTKVVEPWLQNEAQIIPDQVPFGTTAEFIAGARLILERAELSMDAASTPGYESAPAPIQRVIVSLFNSVMRERLFELIKVDSKQYQKREERRNGQTYMQHIAGITAG